MNRGAISTWIWKRLPLWARHMLLWTFNAHFIIGTVAMIDDGDGRILVARHTYRRRTPWALLGGWVRRGEDPADALVREIREETALEADVGAPLAIHMESPTHLTLVYHARLRGGAFRPSAEVSEIRYIGPGTWPEGLRDDHRALIEAFARRPALRRA